ncbi:MAG: M23 family metallopeptidase [Peptostreptococcaceae bacterium]
MKKLLEKDGFYLTLFLCVGFVSMFGIWFTRSSVEELAKSDLLIEKDINIEEEFTQSEEDKEVHFIENNEYDDVVQTSTESEESLETAKAQPEDKLHFLGDVITRGYSDTQPTYSETLDVWEVHKAIDVRGEIGQEIKSLLDGEVVDIFHDDSHGMSIKIKSDDNIDILYSNLSEDVLVSVGDALKEGDSIGSIGNTTAVEFKEGPHIHVEVFKNNENIDPMTVIK